MCGLFLSVGFTPDKRHIDVVAHRGPDGEGWRLFDSPAGPVAFGHRRLSIIDLDPRAAQPMATPDGRYWLVFNGEIYNYIELRSELRNQGVSFRTESDGEVLLEAVRAWGPSALDRLIGMFAFALWDDRDKVLFIARDRVGIKPLVYHASTAGFAAGSEIKQLLDLPGFSRRMDLDRVHDFLSKGLTDHLAGTMFADAKNLGPGRFLRLDLKTWRPGMPLPVTDYWRPPAPDGRILSEEAAAEEFRALFEDSIRLQMRADVKVGSCLSGGLDSSSIVCEQARAWPEGAPPLNAISAVFPGSAVDESRFIDAVIAASGAHSIRTSFDETAFAEDTLAVLRAQDEPYGSTSLHAQYRVFRTARENGIKVMLDGQGADEILGGYHGCFHFHYRRLIQQARLIELLQTLNERKAWHGLSYRQQLRPYFSRLPAPFWMLLRPPGKTPPPPIDWMDTPLLNAHAPREGSVLAQALAAEGLINAKSLGDYCVILTRTTSLPMLLRYEDRNSMAHGIEARVPFLDHRLIEFCLRLGDQHKMVGGDTKRILRRAMTGILPESVRQRRDKLGFATPEETWFKGPLRGMIEAGIEETLMLYPDLFNAGAVRRHTRETLDGDRPFDFSLWQLYIFGVWGRTYGMTL
ncbi:MAG: asparagine synthase (glutamine-hydrolyzing) [Alphaproteobacteria bacterium]|uniref:asparagine synthase (glutamine-hydrolyzing) n=1 Tax=Hyphomonas sp. TaxID=87 RepID=UPI001D5F2D79|nr:asparagine synthase (glutamine-hydrolyzing) [Hyphomonas sp.]MBU4063904.1 asparagine synthase (glutamine-hydrolyzing) [Alphaproteobacteria bacterium]MBU4163298.1 asparagine synthase (glutamine-hydrolyzing) [Alphaproteobacteria bacterium]MBU4568768.1 asparagine synthase (glutamine-hydrolyzing) [Alphaproteobacteria bacterium]